MVVAVAVGAVTVAGQAPNLTGEPPRLAPLAKAAMVRPAPMVVAAAAAAVGMAAAVPLATIVVTDRVAVGHPTGAAVACPLSPIQQGIPAPTVRPA